MSRFLTGLFAALALLISGVPAAAQSIGYSPNTLPLSGSCGVVTVSTPCLNLTQTWNNAAAAFTGLKLNVTDTASAAGSLMDLQVGGVSQFKVDKAGIVDVAGRFVAPFYYVNSDTGAIFFGASLDTGIRRDGAANTLALRNGTAAQAFNIYNTYTDASNYERGELKFDSGFLRLQSTALGTGTQRGMLLNGSEIYFQIAGNNIWRISSAGHFVAVTDNTYDIGAGGANRPRNVYVAGTILAGSSITGANMIAFDAGSIGWNSRIRMFSAVDGTLRITNNAGTITTDITLSGASFTGTSTATFGGSIVSGGNVQAVSAGGFSWLGGKGGITQVTDGAFTFSNNAGSNSVSLTVGASNLLTLNGGLKTTGATFALQTATTLTDNAAAQVATMTNGPAAGNPTKWIAINDNGTTRYIPAW